MKVLFKFIIFMSDKNSEENELKEVLNDFSSELKNIENESIQKIVEVIKKEEAKKVSKAIEDIKNVI